MPTTYYYRSGQRIPVIVADSARAARVADERSLVEVEGWDATPITSHHILLVNKELVTERDTLRTSDKFRNLASIIANHERPVTGRRRKRASVDQERSSANLIDRTDLATFPVAVKVEGEGLLISTGEVVVQFPESVSQGEVEEFAVSNNWTIARTLPFLTNGYVLRASTTADTFEFANQLVEKKGAKFAHPVFLEDIPEREELHPGEERAAPPSPTSAQLFARQWHLQNTGQNGSLQNVDINAASAWKISFGSNNIRACVIDSGVNLNHECFRAPGKLLPGYDFADNDSIPAAVDSSHGTACSALIGASPATGQIVGVAPECRIIPIRRPAVSNHLALAESFAWAADHDADVISCSFGIDGQPWVLPDVVRGALEYATTHGRKGKGCPIFWAAGNGNELVSTDEWASSSFTIAVSASTDQGTKASYSDFGPEVSICAPSSGGVNGIATAVNNGYTTQFGGTSAAAPIAAGVACLVLSVAPNMRWNEVRDLMRRTARRIDSAGGQYDNTGHSPYYGFGQVDAMQALLGVDALLEVERATDTFSLARAIGDFQAYLGRSAAGRVVLSYVIDRRLGILLAIQSDSAFLEAVGRVLRLMADLGPNLISGANVTVPEGIWTALEKIVRTLKLLAPLNLITDRAERSVEPTKGDHYG